MLYQNKYRIEPARLKDWDYSSTGWYYVTICTHNRIHYFGAIKNGKMTLSDMGAIAGQFWRDIPDHFPMAQLDEWIIMPNHVHGIIAIHNNNCIAGDGGIAGRDKALPCLYDGNGNTYIRGNTHGDGHDINGPHHHKMNKSTQRTKPNTPSSRFQNQGKGTISAIVGSYKSICTKTINKSQNKIRFAWQTRFYDHIIRDKMALNRIRKYIRKNPVNWNFDDFY